MGYAYDRECDRFQIGCLQADIKKVMCKDIEFKSDTFEIFGFQVFSQWNEDGLIQYLISKIEIPNRTFVEFGVENYQESNTKFLLMHDNWRGLVMDSLKENISYLKSCNMYWKHNLKAISAFITRENINDLIFENGIQGDIGLLSIDIDGNDYYIWDAITCISPRIVICEVNPYFGKYESVAIPYTETFDRTKAHYSNLYWGGSIKAFCDLADKKGYKLVCINSAGTNVFFVREDLMRNFMELSVEKAWREPMFRESRDQEGNLTFLNYTDGLKLIGDMVLENIETGEERKIKDHIFYKEAILDKRTYR